MNEEMRELYASLDIPPSYYALGSTDSSIISIYEEMFSSWQIVIIYRDNRFTIRAYVDLDYTSKVAEHNADSVKECLEIIDSYIVLQGLVE